MEEKSKEEGEKYPYEGKLRSLLSNYIWTHKIQVCEMDHELHLQKGIRIARGFLYCGSTSSVITSVCFDNQIATIISAVVTFAIAVLDMLLKEEDFAKRIGKLQSVSQVLFHDKNELSFEMIKP